MPATRWGIIGAGGISNDFACALSICDPTEHEVVAIAARNLDRAQEFGKKFNISTCYGSYEELSKDPRVEIVYVATIHVFHAEVSEMMMKAGKHVLCEVPMTLNKKQTERVLATARQNNVFFMESQWTCFFPAISRLKEELAQGTIGEPRILTVSFGYEMPPSTWIMNKKLGGGTAGGMGSFCVLLARIVFKNAKLQRVAASGRVNEYGVDDFVSATLYFDEGRVAQCVMTPTADMDNAMTIYGQDNKSIKIPNHFWAPNELITPSGTQNFPLPPSSTHPSVYPRPEGFVYEIQAVRESLLKGELENALISHEDNIWIVEILDEMRRQIGVQYNADLE